MSKGSGFGLFNGLGASLRVSKESLFMKILGQPHNIQVEYTDIAELKGLILSVATLKSKEHDFSAS